MSMSKTIRQRVLAASIMASALVASTTAPATSLQEVTIGLASGSMAVAGPRIASELGLFEKHGLAAKFVVMDSSSAALTALISGSFKIINSGVPELIVAQSRGQKIVAIVNTYAGFATSLVLAKSVADKLAVSPTAPLKDRLKALDGVIVASTSATAVGTVAFKGAAQAAGANVRFAYMAQSAMPAAIDSGAVQGFTSSAPYWAIPVSKGMGVLWLSGPKGEFPAEFTPGLTAQLQMTREYAEANPALIKNLLAVFADLTGMIDERPADVKAAVAKLYPELDPATLELLFATESLGWKGKPLTVKEMEHEVAIVKSTGVLPQVERVDAAAMVLQ
jgi:ABC-type nitrate/sulfonate/bicarbonate transport system substrate-binding protein